MNDEPMYNNTLRILMVGGGTGGHFFPLVAIAERLSESPSRPRLYYAGPTPYNKTLLQQHRIAFVKIPAGKRRRYFSFLNFFDFFKTLYGLCVALLKLFIVYPDVVISKGGYTSVPVVIAAYVLRIPVVIHESDSVFGRANAFASRFAEYIITTYDTAESSTEQSEKNIQLGIPVRRALFNPPRQNALELLGIDPVRPVILVLGGSQGAERVNEQILASLDDLLKTYTVLHQTGEQNLETTIHTVEKLILDESLRAHYHPIGFLDAETLNDAYHLASVVISRAGSTALYEIALHQKPSIIIPIPETISHDQRSNAYAYARTGGTVVLEEENLKEGILIAEIERIVQNSDIYESMVSGTKLFAKPDAAERIAELLLTISKEHIS